MLKKIYTFFTNIIINIIVGLAFIATMAFIGIMAYDLWGVWLVIAIPVCVIGVTIIFLILHTTIEFCRYFYRTRRIKGFWSFMSNGGGYIAEQDLIEYIILRQDYINNLDISEEISEKTAGRLEELLLLISALED